MSHATLYPLSAPAVHEAFLELAFVFDASGVGQSALAIFAVLLELAFVFLAIG